MGLPSSKETTLCHARICWFLLLQSGAGILHTNFACSNPPFSQKHCLSNISRESTYTSWKHWPAATFYFQQIMPEMPRSISRFSDPSLGAWDVLCQLRSGKGHMLSNKLPCVYALPGSLKVGSQSRNPTCLGLKEIHFFFYQILIEGS